MKTRIPYLLFISSGFLILAFAFGVNHVLARPTDIPEKQASPLHPTFALLDENGDNVLTSAGPVSTMKTCGQCHDTEFIASHAFHSDLGLSDYATSAGSWNSSTGLFGQWNPLTYRFLSQNGDQLLDLSTAEWLMLFGDRVVGGGPATTSRSGQALSTLNPSAMGPETTILDPDNGQINAWRWSTSGSMEMDCFLCHTENPNNEARLQAIRKGEFDDANTATLFGTGIADGSSESWTWNINAFDDEGKLKQEYVLIQDPTNQNCAACHGVVHTDIEVPLVLAGCTWETGTTGQIISSQHVADSGMNIANKDSQTRSWDVHAERGLKCTDCHYALNNPAHAAASSGSDPEHLLYDPRTLEIGEYLEKPDHNIARGQSAQYNVAPELKGTMRRCESCHDAGKSHAGWLPYIETHMKTVACETCHIPKLFAPAIQSYDWTVLRPENKPVSVCRGIESDTGQLLTASASNIPPTVTNLVTGYEPVLIERSNLDGSQLIGPYNLITSYFWVYTDSNGNKRPVRLIDLEAAFFVDGEYAPELVSVFDANLDNKLGAEELTIDNTDKELTVKNRLTALGLNKVEIEGLIQPYSINHDVTRGEWALRECEACHNKESRFSQQIKLADYAPGGVLPQFVSDSNVMATGEIIKGSDGGLYYQPKPENDRRYIFGSSRVQWLDWFGALFFLLTLLGVAGHGTIRFITGFRKPKKPGLGERVYLYESYERFWHWLQTFAIIILLFTGLIIHRPDIFALFNFAGVVIVHNVLAAILAVNALLSLFYHLATGKVRQFIPRPYGFFDGAIEQAKYYILGIFKRAPHPFLKTPNRKLNPLQQITYFGILTVLLPLQGLTGILMWGVQRWPAITTWFGGLPFLAPAHTLIAWIFAAFIVGHVYLTTTGASPLESIRGMVTGYEQIESHLSDEN